MVKHEQRKKVVRDLSKLAQECGCQRLHEDAGRKKVAALVTAVRDSSATSQQKARLRRLFTKYEKTFLCTEPCTKPAKSSQQGTQSKVKPAPVQAAVVEPEQSPQRLRGTSFLNTYNWDFFGEAFPDGTPPAKDHADLWHLWLCWKRDKKKELGASRSTHTMEESLESPLPGRVHLHWKVNLKTALDKPTNMVFVFHGIRPDTRKTFGVPASEKKVQEEHLLKKLLIVPTSTAG